MTSNGMNPPSSWSAQGAKVSTERSLCVSAIENAVCYASVNSPLENIIRQLNEPRSFYLRVRRSAVVVVAFGVEGVPVLIGWPALWLRRGHGNDRCRNSGRRNFVVGHRTRQRLVRWIGGRGWTVQGRWRRQATGNHRFTGGSARRGGCSRCRTCRRGYRTVFLCVAIGGIKYGPAKHFQRPCF